jgi:hypothetical protein
LLSIVVVLASPAVLWVNFHRAMGGRRHIEPWLGWGTVV